VSGLPGFAPEFTLKSASLVKVCAGEAMVIAAHSRIRTTAERSWTKLELFMGGVLLKSVGVSLERVLLIQKLNRRDRGKEAE
jgi:hypothetical protein